MGKARRSTHGSCRGRNRVAGCTMAGLHGRAPGDNRAATSRCPSAADMVDQLMDVLRYFGTLVADVAQQVIEVPEISPQDGNWQRASLRALADVPTILCFLKQTVDTPVPGRGEHLLEGLQRFLPEFFCVCCSRSSFPAKFPPRSEFFCVWWSRSSCLA